ncbi:MAG: N-formylglutamate amidohydrolase [Acidobacteria bacterium]|nr:N-formylglutamate amidohydrolase [Acidobacteriota bacterium]
MPQPKWRIEEGDGPLIATAVHDGHTVREEALGLMALQDAERLREEDPYTGGWTEVAPSRVVGLHSRFEVDLNRPRGKAVYILPEDAWGLRVWKNQPSDAVVAASLAQYDAFYADVKKLLSNIESRFGNFVVFDLHTYNHRREGPGGPAADPQGNPEVNLGTGTIDRGRWGPLVDRFSHDLRAFDFLGRHLDVRENVKFKGGNFSRWIHQTFPKSGCSLAIEFKKFFMDEWTGKLDERQGQAIQRALESTVPGVLEELRKLGVKAG